MSTPAFLSLPLSEIGESPHNPRSSYDLEELEELAESIREVGILEPLLVRPRIRDGEPREVGCWWPPGEAPPQLAALLKTLRVKPDAALAEVTERYAPKVEGSKKVAKKVRVKRDAAEAT